MHSIDTIRTGAVTRRTFAAALGGALATPHALATDPWLAGPSVLAVAEAGAFNGGGFAPSASVQVRSQDASGSQSVLQVQVAADGTLSVVITPGAPGLHNLAVLNSAGAVLALTTFMARL